MLCLTLLAPTCVYVHLLASIRIYLHLLASTCTYLHLRACMWRWKHPTAALGTFGTSGTILLTVRHSRYVFGIGSAVHISVLHYLRYLHTTRTYLHATCTYLPLFSPTCMALAFDLSCIYVQSWPRHTSRRTISKNPAMTRTSFCYKYLYPDNLSHFRCTLLLSPTREYN